MIELRLKKRNWSIDAMIVHRNAYLLKTVYGKVSPASLRNGMQLPYGCMPIT